LCIARDEHYRSNRNLQKVGVLNAPRWSQFFILHLERTFKAIDTTLTMAQTLNSSVEPTNIYGGGELEKRA